MTYNNAREYIKNLNPNRIVPGLNSIKALCRLLGDPQKKLKYIHIAGTNGKGSAGAFTESIILASDSSVARFSSPSVGDYLQMFTINGKPVTRELYTECVMEISSVMPMLHRDGIFPTSFEAETAAAFLMFAKNMPDYVITECGMGGMDDCTNIIPSPLVCIITPISYDHRLFLGETLDAIATHKAGIIKRGASVVTSQQLPDCMAPITKASKKNGSPLYVASDISNISYGSNSTKFIFEGNKYEIPLLGVFQPQNAALAIKTAQLLGINEHDIKSGLAAAKWEYRFERIGRYILDGAHNEAAAAALVDSLKIYATGSNAFICGCFRDKDYMKIARITAPYADAVYCVTPPTSRGLESKVLADAFEKYTNIVYDHKNTDEAIYAASKKNYDNIIIFGSLSILNDAKKTIERIGSL